MRKQNSISGNHIIVLQIIFSLFITTNILAQWNFSLSTVQEFNTNPFRSVDAYSDFVSTYNFGIERELDSFNILYFGSYTGFHTASDINYYWHQIGIYKEADTYVFGAYFEQRINKEANNYFDYLNYSAYYRKSFSLMNVNWKANLSYSSMNYSNIPDFNNWILSAGLVGNKSFETKTTLIGTVIFNYKGFKNYITETDTLREPDYIQYYSEDVNISQIEFNGRLAQSIAENTGLAFNFNIKNILSGSGFSASLIQSTYGEMELYDDPISQEGYSYGAMLSHLFPTNMLFRISYYYYKKDYPSQGIYLSETDYNIDVFRKDTQAIFTTSLSKSFITNEKKGRRIDLNFNYYLIDNTSNSYYFNYNSSAVSASLNYTF